MKKLIIILIALSFVAVAVCLAGNNGNRAVIARRNIVTPAGVAYVGGAIASDAGSPVEATYASTAGNLLVAGCFGYNTDLPITFAISDSEAQGWTAGTLITDAGEDYYMQFFYKENSASVSTVTCTVTNPGGTMRTVVAEFSGIATSSSYEDGANATATGNDPQSGNFTVTTGDLIVGLCYGSTAISADSGTMGPTDNVMGISYEIIAGTTANTDFASGWGVWMVVAGGFLPD